ncbi:nickel-responsive transcriptional regulator NikR [Methanocaldococcus infernus]|nr:nickel-responsive transcriptional regulator NikR [Methanocaldococcus infernus]
MAENDRSMERISISIPAKLLKEFDEVISEKGYASRSEAIRDAIRDYITKYKWLQSMEGERAGSVSVIYDHNSPDVMGKVIDIQHEFSDIIVATLHIHLDKDHCLETILVKGDAKKIREMANKLSATKGVKLVRVSVMSPGGNVPE